LLTEWQTANARNDRERISRVRQVAEDLFKPRQQTVSADVPTSAPDVASSPEHQPRRQPRIFARRSFERRFSLADHMKVVGASLDNDVVHEVPEAAKPRTIKIRTTVETVQPQVTEQKAA
jgi:predicted transcriptional regulator